MLTRREADRFVSEVLALDRLARAPEERLAQLAGAYLCRIPFQSLGALISRTVPTLDQVKADAFSRTGGLCFTMNVFFEALLRALGFDACFALATLHGDMGHGTVLVRGLTAPGALHCVDVGCGYIVPAPLRLPGIGEAPTRHRHGALEVELCRADDGNVRRFHAAAGERSLFWELDPRPRDLDAVARAVSPTYEGYDRLRVVIAAPGLRLLAFKDDLLLEEDSRTGRLSQHRFPDAAAREEALLARLPWLDADLIRGGLGRAGWRRGSFHGRG